MKKMSTELKEQYDPLATQLDKDDKFKKQVHDFVKKHGTGQLTDDMRTTLAAYMADNCKPWREIPKVKSRVLKNAKLLLKNKTKKDKIIKHILSLDKVDIEKHLVKNFRCIKRENKTVKTTALCFNCKKSGQIKLNTDKGISLFYCPECYSFNVTIFKDYSIGIKKDIVIVYH